MQEIYQPSNRVFFNQNLSFPTFMFIQFISNTSSYNYILGSQGLVSKVVSKWISHCMIYVAPLLFFLCVRARARLCVCVCVCVSCWSVGGQYWCVSNYYRNSGQKHCSWIFTKCKIWEIEPCHVQGEEACVQQSVSRMCNCYTLITVI
jgi:hypothetical protein